MTLPRLVLDTNAWLDWLVFADPCITAIKSAAHRDQAALFIDAPCREELARVLGYRLGRFTLDAAGQSAVLDECRRIARFVEAGETRSIDLPLCADPDDQKFLQLALAARADFLITKDRELLALAHRTPFRILRPEAFGAPEH